MSSTYFFEPFNFFKTENNPNNETKQPFGSNFTQDLSEIDAPQPNQAATGPNITPTWSGGPDGGADWDF